MGVSDHKIPSKHYTELVQLLQVGIWLMMSPRHQRDTTPPRFVRFGSGCSLSKIFLQGGVKACML